jgi:hypothetical protein
VTQQCRTLRNKELYDDYSPNIRVTKSPMRLAGHVARMRERREVHTGSWWGDLNEGARLENLVVDWRIE